MNKLSMATAITGIVCGALLHLTGCQHTQKSTAQKDLNRWPVVSSPNVSSVTESEQVEVILSKMSVEEKVGQILQGEIQTVTPADVKKYHLGSVLNGGGSLPYRKTDATTADWVKLADDFYNASMDDSDGRVAIPILWGTDAVHGHNNVQGATLFPHNMSLGATHNPELIRKIGAATAKEVRATGVDWVFAPTLAVARNDFWGRTYESYSEDPAIVKEYASAMVEGLQGVVGEDDFLNNHHVLACAKHFLGDGGTFHGDDQGDARISEQELIDVHNAGYPAAIESGVQSIMASFSSWNGEKLHGSTYLLTDVLRGKMGFDGLVVGDWNGHGQLPGCTNDSCAAAINAGVDLIMVPYDWKAMYKNTLEQVNAGEIPMARLDEAVRRILRVKIRGGLFNGKPSERLAQGIDKVVGSQAHRDIARQAVRESLVLLKNNNGLLPLNPKQKVLVAGAAADSIPTQSGGWSITWQGTGTTNEQFPGATSIYSGINNVVTEAGGQAVLSVDGSYTAKPDVAIVVFGEQPYAEGHGDRDTLEFEPGVKKSLALLQRLQSENIPVVSVFISGRPMWVNPELNASDAFVAAWLPGSEGGGVSEVLFANADGSIANDFKGRLSFSWPKLPLQAEVNGPTYKEQPLFKLGYGLSYAKKAENLSVLPEKVKGIFSNKTQDVPFYVGRTLQPWQVFIRNPERDQVLSGAFAALPEGDVKIQTMDKDLQEDALRFTWKDTWQAGLQIKGGKPMDLTPYLEAGVVSFDLNVLSFPNSGLSVELMCGDNCSRKVSLMDYAIENEGKGWKNVSISMSCFKQANDDFSSVVQPFNIDAGGKGEIAIANVKFLLKGKPTLNCPDYKNLSVSPEPLNEYWAKEWWMPRHQKLVKQLVDQQPQVLMIGDSITEGWGDAGKAVWEKFYAKRNAINLGFGGDRTENVLWRLQNGALNGVAPKLAVLMIGTNNTGHRLESPELTANGIKAILDELKLRLPKTKVLLLAVFPREANPDAPMRKINEAINERIQGYADGEYVHFLNINNVFLNKDGILERSVMPDLLHLNESSYSLWANAMEPEMARLLGE